MAATPKALPTVAQIVAQTLKRHGVRLIFSQSLPSAVALACEDIGIPQYTYRTENAGGAMADGFARLANHAAVVMAQNGPAATLLVPPLAEALKASIPVVALVQDVNRAQTDRNAFQDADHMAMFGGVTKWVRRVSEPDRVVDYLDMAFTQACTGRPGPVVLMLPADMLLEATQAPVTRQSQLASIPLDRSCADPARIKEAAALIAGAKNPLVVAGGGVHLSQACAEATALLTKLHLPVMTTVMGKGAVDEKHPLSMGVAAYNLGKLSPARDLRGIVERADVVLLIGTRTNQNGTDSWQLYPDGARYIHIDVDGTEIGRNYESLRLVGDAKLTLAALIAELEGKLKPRPAVEKEIAAARETYAGVIAPVIHSNQSPLRPEKLMADIEAVMTPETIVVADASYSTLWVACYLRSLLPGQRFITPRGLAGLGWGLPLAIGAKLANPKAPVVCVVGDGGFGHVWSELETCKRNGTAIALTVLNNGVLGYQKDAEDVKFGRHSSACYFSAVDHAAVARACGLKGVRIERAADYLPALREALASNETVVLDVVTDPEAYPPITFFEGALEKVRAEREGKKK